MEPLTLLRVLTLAVRSGLAVALLHLVIGRRRALGPALWVAWSMIAAKHVIVTVDNAGLEGLALLTRDLPDTAWLERFRLVVYHFTYLLHSMLSEALPAALIVRLAAPGRIRLAAVSAIAAGIAIGGVALAADALHSWDSLLRFTRVLSFIGLIGYLGFWALLALGRLSHVDAYLAGFIGTVTLFELLLPVQEAFFQMVGRASAPEIWHLLQFLQFATGAAQLGIVVALLNILARRRRPAPIRLSRRLGG